ncbi:hypothetical protein [Oceanicola sp. D3]|uniref:hypothetical protein n=1 Tax=Oceanicola sp. D3 TaxID=2587163 RepID=UPI00143D4D94|nr:hypothetical protein [Oceanicola sp. D3]
MLDLWHMMLASVGVGGFVALWALKALASVAVLRAVRRWRMRRALRLGQGV